MFVISYRWRLEGTRKREGRSVLHCECGMEGRWYRKWDLNPHAVMAPAFETGMSTNSIISAYNALGFTPLLSGVTGYKTCLSKAL